MPKTYPTNVSRTLDPSGKSLITVVGLHDKQITDADINLMQDLQDSKRQRLLADQVTSGALTYQPLSFKPFLENVFFVNSFDVLFNGEVITVTGSQSTDQTLNRVLIPAPAFWTTGVVEEQARIYVVFLEIWYQALNPLTGQGYFIDPITGLRYFYPYGNIQPDPSHAENLPDDSVDPFQGLFTTERAQLQWRLNVQRVGLNYDFSKYKFGLDPDTTDVNAFAPMSVYAQATQPAPVVLPSMQFTNMGGINGDTALWRAGDGNVNNALGTMDGYTYAMPVAVVFQRNSGPFDLANNLFGCAAPGIANSGLIASQVSGRFDSKLADQVFPDDCVDTRSTINLSGWDLRKIMAEGFVDVITGVTRQALARGESPGNSPSALGSTLSYTIAVAPTILANTNTVGTWDGFTNGFSADQRIFEVTQAVSINQKALGQLGSPWVQNDAFTVQLPLTSNAVITDLQVTALVSNTQNGTKTPTNLLQGQLTFNGLGSRAVTVVFTKDLKNTLFDPGTNNLYVTLSIQYPASSGIDLRKVPFAVNGGYLQDTVAGKTLPAYGVSEYVLQTAQTALQPLAGSPAASPTAVGGVPINTSNFWIINPKYSNVLFGSRIWLEISGGGGVQTIVGGSPITTFIIPRATINSRVSGWYCTRAWDLATGLFYNISSRTIAGSGTDECTLVIQGAVDPSSTVVFSFIAQDTCQVAYNAPVKGATSIEETVLIGNLTGNSKFQMDSRVTVASVAFDAIAQTNTVVMVANNALIKGISGDDVNQFVWVQDNFGNLNAVLLSSVNFNNGIITAICPSSVNLLIQPFFFITSLLPAFDPTTTFVAELQYVPYQGEGTTGRNYEILFNEDNALVTTNGTGAAPIIGLHDVYPYNRELPIITTLPSQVSWNDSGLDNTPLASFFDDNYSSMRFANVEDVFLAPLHTNDFIPPVNRDIRKEIQFLTTGGRGFATAIPHLGYAIKTPTPKTVLGQNLQSTIAPIIIYVNNLSGSDSSNGLTPASAVQTIGAAMALFPPVLRHPCSIQLIFTGVAYTLTQNSTTLVPVSLGDGNIVATKWYALANIAFTVQSSGRFVVSTEPSAPAPVVIDATGFTGFGDGPTSAFFVDTTRVIFNNLEFRGFTDPAIKGINSDIEFVDCIWQDNVTAGSFEQGCGVVLTQCAVQMGNGGNGIIVSGSQLTVSHPLLIVEPGTTPGPFFVAERQSNMTLQTHGTSNVEETNVASSTVIADAEISSSIVCNADWQSVGSASIKVNSALSRTVTINPFLGGIITDPSSSVVTNV